MKRKMQMIGRVHVTWHYVSGWAYNGCADLELIVMDGDDTFVGAIGSVSFTRATLSRVTFGQHNHMILNLSGISTHPTQRHYTFTPWF